MLAIRRKPAKIECPFRELQVSIGWLDSLLHGQLFLARWEMGLWEDDQRSTIDVSGDV